MLNSIQRIVVAIATYLLFGEYFGWQKGNKTLKEILKIEQVLPLFLLLWDSEFIYMRER